MKEVELARTKAEKRGKRREGEVDPEVDVYLIQFKLGRRFNSRRNERVGEAAVKRDPRISNVWPVRVETSPYYPLEGKTNGHPQDS